jgi:hypothetical protein
MATRKSSPKTLVEAVQAVFDALEPFDDAARNRILQSAASLLGTALPAGVASANAPAHSVGSSLPQARSSDRPLSPVELLQQKQPATNAQRIAVFAYFRDKVEGLARFAKDDLRGYFAKAKQPAPQNFDRDFRQAVSLGWIYEDSADSYITSKGLEAVEAGFGGKALPRGSASSKKKTRTKGARSKRKKQ